MTDIDFVITIRGTEFVEMPGSRGRTFVDSEDVARSFGKKHDAVLRRIEALLTERPNLESSEDFVLHPSNQFYLISQNGLMWLTHGLQGAEGSEGSPSLFEGVPLARGSIGARRAGRISDPKLGAQPT